MADVLLYLVTVLIWGSTWFAITFQLGHVPIEWSLVYRFALSAVALLGFCAVTGRNLRFSKALHLKFVGLGLLLFSANYYVIYAGIEHVPSGLAAVLFSMLPLLNILNGMIFLKRKGNAQVAWLSLLGMAGIALLFWPEVEGFTLQSGALLGLVLVSAGVWFASAGNTLASTEDVKGVSVIQSTAWGIFYGTLFLGALALLKGNAPAFDPSPAYVISLAYLTLFGTIIAFTCYFLLIKRISVERAAYITIAFPPISLGLSTAFEGYQWTWQAAVGMVFILGGNYWVLKTREKAKAAGLAGAGAK